MNNLEARKQELERQFDYIQNEIFGCLNSKDKPDQKKKWPIWHVRKYKGFEFLPAVFSLGDKIIAWTEEAKNDEALYYQLRKLMYFVSFVLDVKEKTAQNNASRFKDPLASEAQINAIKPALIKTFGSFKERYREIIELDLKNKTEDKRQVIQFLHSFARPGSSYELKLLSHMAALSTVEMHSQTSDAESIDSMQVSLEEPALANVLPVEIESHAVNADTRKRALTPNENQNSQQFSIDQLISDFRDDCKNNLMIEQTDLVKLMKRLTLRMDKHQLSDSPALSLQKTFHFFSNVLLVLYQKQQTIFLLPEVDECLKQYDACMESAQSSLISADQIEALLIECMRLQVLCFFSEGIENTKVEFSIKIPFEIFMQGVRDSLSCINQTETQIDEGLEAKKQKIETSARRFGKKNNFFPSSEKIRKSVIIDPTATPNLEGNFAFGS